MPDARWKIIGSGALACALLMPVALWGQPSKDPEGAKDDSNGLFEGFAAGGRIGDPVVSGSSANSLAAGKARIAARVEQRKPSSRPLGPPLNVQPDNSDLDKSTRRWFMTMFTAGMSMGGAALTVALRAGDKPLLAAAGLMLLIGSWIIFGPDRWRLWPQGRSPGR